ncbi:MAG TPA: cytochrome c biogenesis protein ResB [Thermomicrobiales bacterium]|nr:cytochrome c biogenesis protein ResB [Thermomicrobiales bacterium]
MAQASATTRPPSRSPLETAVDRVWRFFCSVRAAIYEISFLALLVLIGTLRGSEVPQWIADAAPPLQPLVDRWYAWDVFGSPLFAATLAVIAIAIAVCTLNRVPGIWQTISEPRVRTSVGYVARSEVTAEFIGASNPEALEQRLRDALADRRYRVFTERVGDQIHVYADKNRWSKFGTFPFHLALILLLVGGIVASMFGFRDTEFAVAEGETRAVGHGTDLSVELVRFRDAYIETGDPAEYRSDVIIYDDGSKVKDGEITVNSPISAGVATFYQASFGIASDIVVRDALGNVLFDAPVEMGFFNLRANPDAPAGLIRLPAQGVQIAVVAPDVDRANRPDLDTLNLANGQVWVQVSPLNSSPGSGNMETAVLDQGDPAEVGGYEVLFDRESRFTVLQVAYNPGIPIFFIASVLLVGGLAVTFYFPMRRIRGIIQRSAEDSSLIMTPLAKRDWGGKREFFRVSEEVGKQLGVTPKVKRPDHEGYWDDESDASEDDTNL